MKFFDYSKHAEAYSLLDIVDTYYLVYRDIPKIISKFVKGKKALDYGCGAGRSTRFLKNLGFDTVGVDISEKMINEAKKKDSSGRYSFIESDNLKIFEDNTFDFILSAMTFDSFFSKEDMIKISKEMKRVLKRRGVVINITSTPELYTRNWASFICDFPENKNAKNGDKVKVVVRGTDIAAFDHIWADKDYKEVFKRSGLKLIKIYKPLAKGDEPYKWINETKIPPWFIYVLRK